MNTSKITYAILALLLSLSAVAQENMHHNSQLFYVKPTTDVFINGNLQSNTGNNNALLNQGEIHVTDSLVNYGNQSFFGLLPDTLGSVHLIGTTRQVIDGTNINFSNVHLNGTNDTILLKLDTLTTTRQFNFVSGNVNVDSTIFHLSRSYYGTNTVEGTIVGENNTNRIYGLPGYIRFDRPMTSGTNFSNLHGTGLDLSVVGNLGASVEVRRINGAQATPANGSVSRVYEFIPSIPDQVSFPQTQYFDDNELNAQNEDSLKLYLSLDAGLSWRDQGGTTNTSTDKTESSTAVVFTMVQNSMLTLAEDSCTDLPFVDIVQDTIALCNGANAWISTLGTAGMEVFWSTGQYGLDSINVSTPGMYWIRVVNEKGCPKNDTVYVITAPDPVVDFTVASACETKNSSFVNNSTVSAGTNAYSWNFGDPFSTSDTSTQVQPTYKYTQFGSFTTTLTATTNYGCVKSLSKTAVVLPYPTADFMVDDKCADSLLSFSNLSSISNNAGITYAWDFGDGNTSTVLSPTHTYPLHSTYPVQLIASSNGCTDTLIKDVDIHVNPVASFTNLNACPNTDIMLGNTSQDFGATVTYAWDFGNGANSAVSNPPYTYANAGTYTVILTASTSFGCEDTATSKVFIHPQPAVDFSAANVCEGQVTAFNNATTLTNGTFDNHWDFGDGNASTTLSPTHTYTNDGAYNVTLTVTSDSGCVAALTKNITAEPLPTVAFTMADNCEQKSIAFTNATTALGGLTHHWDFDNGTVSTQENPTETYINSGVYNVKLTATTAFGCKDSLIKPLTIHALPTVNIGNNVTTCGNSLTIDAGNPGSAYLWSNGATSQIATANFSGQYHVKVTDGNGCVNRDTVNVILNTAVTPDLGPDAIVCDSVVLTTSYPLAGNTFTWNTSATTDEITATTSGQYHISITDQNGCVGSDTVNLIVNNSNVVALGPDIVTCANVPVTLDAGFPTATFLWNTNAVTQTIQPTTSGTYFVAVTNAVGCVGNDTINVLIHPVPALDFGPDVAVCDSVRLDATHPNVTYNWSVPSVDSTLLVSTTGSYWATITANATSCVNSDTIAVTVNATPTVNLGEDTVLCSYENVVIDAQNTGATYLWSNGNTAQTDTLFATGQYWAEVTTPLGCATADTINITINDPIELLLGEDTILCANSTLVLDAGFTGGTYDWGSDSGFVGNTAQVTVNQTGNYWLTYTDTDECVATDSIALQATSLGVEVRFIASSDLITGDTIQFVNLSSPQPFDSYWNMGDGFYTIENSPKHAYFQGGTYDVTLEVSNGTCSEALTKQITVLTPRIDNRLKEEDYANPQGSIMGTLLYPNPNNGNFTFEIAMKDDAQVQIDIYDITGRHVVRDYLAGEKIKKEYDFNHLKSGLYFVRVASFKDVATVKFIIAD